MTTAQETILVCGGGMAGMATALGLKKNGFQVAILAPKPKAYPLADEQYHPRVYALSVASQQFLETLGVWGLVPAQRVTPVEAMPVRGDAAGEIMLAAWQIQRAELACVVESGTLQQASQQASAVSGEVWLEDHSQGG